MHWQYASKTLLQNFILHGFADFTRLSTPIDNVFLQLYCSNSFTFVLFELRDMKSFVLLSMLNAREFCYTTKPVIRRELLPQISAWTVEAF